MRTLLSFGAKRPHVNFDGDSNTAGTTVGGAANAWPARVVELLQPRPSLTNKAVSGHVSGNIPHADYVAPARLFVCMIGTNDLIGGGAAATIMANIEAALATVRAAGVDKCVLCTVLPSTLISGGDETSRVTLNGLIAASSADDVIDFAADAYLSNTGNFPDGTHPDVDGHIRMAQVAAPVLQSLLRGP